MIFSTPTPPPDSQLLPHSCPLPARRGRLPHAAGTHPGLLHGAQPSLHHDSRRSAYTGGLAVERPSLTFRGQRYLRLPGCQVLHHLPAPTTPLVTAASQHQPASTKQHSVAARLVSTALHVAHGALPFRAVSRPEFSPRVRISCRASQHTGQVRVRSITVEAISPLPPEHRRRPAPPPRPEETPTEQARDLAAEFFHQQANRQQPAELFNIWGTFEVGERIRPFAGTMSLGRKGSQLTQLQF